MGTRAQVRWHQAASQVLWFQAAWAPSLPSLDSGTPGLSVYTVGGSWQSERASWRRPEVRVRLGSSELPPPRKGWHRAPGAPLRHTAPSQAFAGLGGSRPWGLAPHCCGMTSLRVSKRCPPSSRLPDILSQLDGVPAGVPGQRFEDQPLSGAWGSPPHSRRHLWVNISKLDLSCLVPPTRCSLAQPSPHAENQPPKVPT